MKMLNFMRRHDIKEWSFVHILLGVIICLTCIVSGLFSLGSVFTFLIGKGFMFFGISLAVFAVSLAFFIYIGVKK